MGMTSQRKHGEVELVSELVSELSWIANHGRLQMRISNMYTLRNEMVSNLDEMVSH